MPKRTNVIELPQLPEATSWRRAYLANWEKLIQAQREILSAQLRLLEASEAVIEEMRQRKEA